MINADKFKQERIKVLKDEIKSLEEHSSEHPGSLISYIQYKPDIKKCHYCAYRGVCDWGDECREGILEYLKRKVQD